MYLFPSPAQTGEFVGERRLDAPQLARCEAVAFPHLGGPCGQCKSMTALFPPPVTWT
jgi:hypothetical protein